MKFNLSEISDLIKSRRTILPEQFSDRLIHKEQVEVLLNNAIWAPNHGMTQPWTFKVFLGEGRQKLADFLGTTYKKVMAPEDFVQAKFDKLSTRPTMAGAVIVVSLKRDPKSRIPEIEEIEAIACAIQNMQLTCTAWGLGSFWASPGIIYRPEMNEFLGLDENDKCLALLFVGYPKPDLEWPRSRRKPIEYMTTWVEE